MNLKDVATTVLREAGPLHTNEIVKRAADKGLLKLKTSTPAASMSAAIYMDIKKHGKRSAFKQTSPGTFELRSDHARASSRSIPESQATSSGTSNNRSNTAGEHSRRGLTSSSRKSKDNRSTGTAGEHRVSSELLLRGYKINTPAIDDGIDLMCSKSGHNFNIQVKTVNAINGRHVFTIREKAFAKHDGPEMRYIFALLHADFTFDFVIMSSKDINRMLDENYMTKNTAGYQASFQKTSGGIFLGKNRKHMQSYTNDWNF